MKPCEFSITRTRQGWECATVLGNHRVHQQYIGYTKRESQTLFREYLRTLESGS